jgi:phage tail P2-like protein
MDLKDISILNIMPPNLSADRNIKMIAESFDKVLRDVINKIPDLGIIPNLVLDKIVNETLIDLLAWQFHVDFYDPKLPIEIKRELVLKSLDWHFRKGTPSVVEEIVSTVFFKLEIQEWFEYGGHPYRFRIKTEEELPDREGVDRLKRAVNSVKNTRSFLDVLTLVNNFHEEIIIDDMSALRIRREDTDSFGTSIKYDGTIKYDGKTINNKGVGKVKPQYLPLLPFKYSGRILDVMIITNSEPSIKESAKMNDMFSVGMRNHHNYDGAYKYDGVIKFNGNIFISLE